MSGNVTTFKLKSQMKTVSNEIKFKLLENIKIF